jgi:hypothetical protein
MDRPRVPRTRQSINEELEASALALFWGGEIKRGQAEMDAGKQRRDIGTRNYVMALERLIPFRLITEGEPISARVTEEEDGPSSDVAMEEGHSE